MVDESIDDGGRTFEVLAAEFKGGMLARRKIIEEHASKCVGNILSTFRTEVANTEKLAESARIIEDLHRHMGSIGGGGGFSCRGASGSRPAPGPGPCQ